jgi:hypothetical protein
VPLRRDEVMLMSPDPRDWLPVDHVVWFLIDAVAAMDTSSVDIEAVEAPAAQAGDVDVVAQDDDAAR